MASFFRDWRRRRILEKYPLSDALWEQGLELVPALDDLSDVELEKLRDLVTVFLHEKVFESARGFEIDDRVRIVIACLCCLVILELDLDAYVGLKSIIVYPGQFKTRHEHVDEHGIAHIDEGTQSGESAPEDGIALSWADVVESVQDPYDGYNVVIHECAHKLDMLGSGDADGAPPLHAGMDQAKWKSVFSRAFEHFCWEIEHGGDTQLDEYGAESPSEFFAVMTEAFFECPDILCDEYPEVYDQLQALYRQDTIARMPPPEHEASGRPEDLN